MVWRRNLACISDACGVLGVIMPDQEKLQETGIEQAAVGPSQAPWSVKDTEHNHHDGADVFAFGP